MSIVKQFMAESLGDVDLTLMIESSLHFKEVDGFEKCKQMAGDYLKKYASDRYMQFGCDGKTDGLHHHDWSCENPIQKILNLKFDDNG